jgi:hypothetical protein
VEVKGGVASSLWSLWEGVKSVLNLELVDGVGI